MSASENLFQGFNMMKECDVCKTSKLRALDTRVKVSNNTSHDEKMIVRFGECVLLVSNHHCLVE